MYKPEHIHDRPAHRRGRGRAAGAATAALLAVMFAGPPPAALAEGDAPAARDLTVEQTAVFSVQAPAPAAAASGALSVVAWVDHADNTYAVGEKVRLFVKTNKDAYLTVLNVGASGRTTILFPNVYQTDTRVPGNRVVEIPAPSSGASLEVSGPTGRELIKVIASTSPTPLLAASQTRSAGPFTAVEGDTRSVARDLQVTMDTEHEQEWDDYNKVITTIASRPVAAAPMVPAPAGTAWPAPAFDLRIATGKSAYRLGEAVSLYLSTSVPCYLTLVEVGASGQARVLLPNAAQPQNLLPAGGTVVFPAVGSGVGLTPMGPAGIGTVVAVCSTDNRPVFAGGLSYGPGGFAVLGGDGGAVTRDLAVVSAGSDPGRRTAQATVGFLVMQ